VSFIVVSTSSSCCLFNLTSVLYGKRPFTVTTNYGQLAQFLARCEWDIIKGMESLRLPHSIYQAMVDHLQAVYPLEGCGLLAGRPGLALRSYPVENALGSPVAFTMEPAQQLAALLALEAEGLELVAIYHSHPAGPERPSPSDIAQAYYSDAAQVIVSLADRERPLARAFMVGNGRFHEIPLLLE
jgi:[CysO sulfur-carrier protein]-S-L-cysteine hydrolase